MIAESARSRGGPMSVRDVCTVCVRVLAADGAGVSLLNGDRLEPVQAEGALSRPLLEAELTTGDGPCVEAVATGLPVAATDLGDARCRRRWPFFTATAYAGDIAAAFAFPLISRMAPIGVLAACRSRPGTLSAAAHRDALILADTAVTLLLTGQADAVPDDWLALGAEIHQAAGMVSVQLDCTVEQALARLRGHAFAHELPVTQVAKQVVERILRFTPDTSRP
ncbi:GAF and ANTAR domain-containing protein [Actinomadura fulvescens]|uniref:GAF and ANTAR domain-containing protein n=1 Tax=Actinomadura fulvescens TaxID=46160 RepID=UPI0031E284EB